MPFRPRWSSGGKSGAYSLAFRAAALVLAFYVVIFVAGLAALGRASLSLEEDHHAGSSILLDLAASELRIGDNTLHWPTNGRFAQLLEDNPQAWLRLYHGDRQYSIGAVPASSEQTLALLARSSQAAKFHVAGLGRPYSDSVLQRIPGPIHPIILASGGVDPRTIGLSDVFAYTVSQGGFLIIIFGLAGILVVVLLAVMLQRTLRPITRLVGGIEPGGMKRQIPLDEAPSELHPLISAFNASLERDSDELARRKRFIADLAHEFRTPLTILALQVDALPPSPRRNDLARVIMRMEHLAAQMMDVERLSSSAHCAQRVDLSQLTSQVVGDLAPLADASGYDIALDLPEESVEVRGDSHALGRAVTNLVANAIAHGGNRGLIRVALSSARVLSVSDEGPGVPEHLSAHLFEPFTRERWDRDGCGLGLHLTREIMRAHGGEALLCNSGPRPTFELRFGS